MLTNSPSDLDGLGPYIDQFLGLAGRDRWFKRCDQLDIDQRRSFFQWKIVTDYHWLEMAIAFQADVFAKERRLKPEMIDELILAAVNFAASTVEVHARLSDNGKRIIEGRIRDSLKADTGFSSLYLEITQAQRLMNWGYDVEFTDMEGTAPFDLLFGRGNFIGEVECKSISADAGRQIHRKDFYRFMETIRLALVAQAEMNRREVCLITLNSRLPSNEKDQKFLADAMTSFLRSGVPAAFDGNGFRLERRPFAECLGDAPLDDQKVLYRACKKEFGQSIHIAGGLTENGGCVVVMRSNREDDPSKPKLEAFRKAIAQLSGKRPAFIAIQEHGIEPADLMLPDVRRKAGILAYALFGHYGGDHVNGIHTSGFGAVVQRDGLLGTPAFVSLNPAPRFPINAFDAAPFLLHMPDADYATMIGAPLPAANISILSIYPEEEEDENLA